ncbi:MAG: hypothetical protein IJX72_05950 [Clostridia bacterium]|nr:hypothetical protein [Clostridia bacterium]
MKKTLRILTVLTAAMLLLSATAVTASASADDLPYNAFADYGQQTYDVPATETEIKIDGVVSEGEYACTPIEVNKDSEGMTWLDWTKEGFPEEELTEILPFSMKYYVTYNAEGLYVAAEIVEASLYTRCDQASEIWGLDSLEIDVAVDAYGDIPKGTYSQSYMLDRLRSCYALWDDGSGVLTPTGLCYTASSYGLYQVLQDMGEGTYMITRNDEKQLTTYEMFFCWDDLYMDTTVPNQVFLNFQLHLGDGRYLDYVQDGYIACLGGLRYACQLSDEDKAELGTSSGMALHIFNLVDADKLNGKTGEETTAEAATETTPVTEAPTVAVTETPTAAPTDATTNASTDTNGEGTAEIPTEKGGCGAVVGMGTVAMLVAVAAAVALKKKD